MNKKIKFIIAEVLVISLMGTTSVYADEALSTATSKSIGVNSSESVESTGETEEVAVNEATIELKDNGTTVTGEGVVIEGNIVTINRSGVYTVSGTLTDGQIIVDVDKTADAGDVEIDLAGANITCSNSAAIYVKQAENTSISAKKDTQNYVTDGTNYVFANAEDDEPNGAIFSKDDLEIKGKGSLTVKGNYKNGIVSKDDLDIKNCNLNVTAVNDAIKGKDSIEVDSATITVNAGGDGLKSSNDTDEDKGYINISSGTLDITSGNDGIQAEKILTIDAGDIKIVSGGGSVNASSKGNDMQGQWNQTTTTTTTTTEEESNSAKALKAGTSLVINDGTFSIDSSDDSIHTNDAITINGGKFDIASGDDGVHADTTLNISGGNINIKKCYEGLESSTITIKDGTVNIVASDDGINASDGSSSSEMPGQNGFGTVGNNKLVINGGNVSVNASGDGLDANGSIEMTAGTVIVNGPTNNGNGPLDYDGTFNITGGTLIAAGSSGMAQSPSVTSTQNSIKLTFASAQKANTLVHVEDENGNEVATFAPSKTYQSVVISSSSIEIGKTYKISSGGTSTGTAENGLYTGGVYSGGTVLATAKISSVITNVSSDGTVQQRKDGEGQMGGGTRPQSGTTTPGGTGTRPQRPGSSTVTPGGTRPEYGTQTPGGQMPEMPDGEMPEFPDGEMPDGQMPEIPNGEESTGTPTDNVDGNASKDTDSNTADSNKLMVLFLGISSAVIMKLSKIKKAKNS